VTPQKKGKAKLAEILLKRKVQIREESFLSKSTILLIFGWRRRMLGG